jgi:transposase
MEDAMSEYDYEIGLDLHKSFSMLALVDKTGKCLQFDKLDNNITMFDHYFNQLYGTYRVTFESTRNWYWLADYLQERKIDFIMSNPYLNRALAHVHAKNDKYDARMLAHLAQSRLIATCYIPDKSIRHLRELIFYRSKLLQIRTKLKNRIHLMVDKYNFKAPYDYIFGPNGINWLETCEFPEVIKQIVRETLQIIAELNPRIELYYNRIKDRVEKHPYHKILTSVYGFGVIHSGTIIARVADINRFPTVEGFIRYCGLSVNTRASADKLTYGHLNRQADKYLRTAFVEASYLVIKHDSGLRAFYDYLRAQKGHGCAICAVARKLARSVYFMLKNKTVYRIRKIQPKYIQHKSINVYKLSRQSESEATSFARTNRSDLS